MQHTLTTARLVLRPWREADAEALFTLARDPQVGPVAGWPVHRSVEESRDIIASVLSAPGIWAVTLPTDDIPIGSIGLTVGQKGDWDMGPLSAELGYWVGVPHWGNGYLPEAAEEVLRYAFEDLSLQAVWCGYYDGNDKSRRVQEKCGFAFHHTEHGKLCPLLNETRTEHFTVLTCEAWQRQRLTLEVRRLDPRASLAYATEGAAAMDLTACIDVPLTLEPGTLASVPAGVAVALPSAEYVALVFARSGLGVKHGICLSNGVGVIDSDYRGEIRVGLTNLSQIPYTIQPGDRVAQLAILPVARPTLRFVDALDKTARGGGGFGSTGK